MAPSLMQVRRSPRLLHTSRRPRAQSPPRKRRRTLKTALLDLPDELIYKIARHLTGARLRTRALSTTKAALAFAQTCKRVNALVGEAVRGSTRSVDAVFPGRPDGPDVIAPPGMARHLRLLSCMLQASLKEIRIPRIENLHDVLEKVALCTGLERLAFVDEESVGRSVSRRLLLGKPNLRAIEVTEPGSHMLAAVRENKSATDVSLLGVRSVQFGLVKRFLRMSGRRLTRFCIGCNGDEVRFRNTEAVSAAKSLLNYLGSFAKRDMPNISYVRVVCNLAGSWFLAYMQRLVGLLCPTSDVEIVVMGMPLVFPTMRDGMSESYHRSISLLMIARLPANIVMHAYTDGIFRPDTVELNGHRDHLLQYLRGGEDVKNSVAAIVRRAKPHLRRLQIHFTCGSMQAFRLVARCISEILTLAPGISELELSREVIVYGVRGDSCWEDALKLMGRVKVLHLNAPEKYVRVTRLPRVGNGRMVREVGHFLEMIAKYCPNLESVYFEDAGDLCSSRKGHGRMSKPIRAALDGIDLFESRLPRVDASSLRSQLLTWSAG